MKELEFIIPHGTQDVGGFIKQKFADACIDPKDGVAITAMDTETLDTTFTWQHKYMKVQVKGKQFRCGSMKIIPLHEDGRKRLVLYDAQDVNPENRVIGDLSPGEIVTIKI